MLLLFFVFGAVLAVYTTHRAFRLAVNDRLLDLRQDLQSLRARLRRPEKPESKPNSKPGPDNQPPPTIDV